jgi:hypothetical protein
MIHYDERMVDRETYTRQTMPAAYDLVHPLRSQFRLALAQSIRSCVWDLQQELAGSRRVPARILLSPIPLMAVLTEFAGAIDFNNGTIGTALGHGELIGTMWGLEIFDWPRSEDHPESMRYDMWIAVSDGTDEGTVGVVRSLRYQDISANRQVPETYSASVATPVMVSQNPAVYPMNMVPSADSLAEVWES